MNRLFVEKKTEFNAEARHLLHDLRESLSLNGLEGVRVIQRYDIDGLSNAEFAAASQQILSEPQVDVVTSELSLSDEEIAFAVEFLPGQFDQRADSAAQCVQILTGKDRPLVASAKVIVLQGTLSDDEIRDVKDFVINAVDSHEASMEVPLSLKPNIHPPADVALLGNFIRMSADELATLRSGLGLAMSDADLAFCQQYFRDEEKRDPSITEIRMLDTYWSDHCRHTTFLTRIDEATFAEGTEVVEKAWQTYLATRESVFGADAHNGRRPVSLMDIALLGMRELKKSGELDNLEVSEEVNAASIVVSVSISNLPSPMSSTTEEWLIMFKNETHNHPTEIEPFGGAATCLGGCIRDPLSGRSYVYQAMRVTGAGDPLTPFNDTLPGKLPQKKICQVAAHGYASYGNQIGLATGQVAEVYHPGYVAKRMEIGAVVAAAPRSQVFRGAPAPGDVILLIGGRTGRDGVGGATGSSKEHTDTALENSAEVQKGDAPTERKIQRLFRNPELTKKIKICNDFGAGGVSVAIGEIAPSLDIDLDAVPKKYDGLDGTELAISESQERMAVCVDPSEVDYFIREADLENLECVKVALVGDHGRLRMNWRGKTIVDLSRAFLDTNGVQQTAKVHVQAPQGKFADAIQPPHTITEALSDLNTCSQKGLGEIFDGSVGAGTVLWPFGGKHQITPPDAMVAKLPLLDGESDVCTYMSWAYNPHLSSWSPFHGAVYAVTESVCKAVAAGARLSDVRLTLQEYFPKLGTDAARWGLPFAALLGAFHAQHELRLAAIGGKDSMSGSFNELDVPPTLVSFALAPGFASRALSPEFKAAGNTVSIVEIPRDENNLPDFARLKAVAETLHALNGAGAIVSMHAPGHVGIAAALAKMSFGNRIGFEGSVEDLYHERLVSFIIEHSVELPAELEAQMIGQTIATPELRLPGESYPLDELLAAWTGKLEPIYPTLCEPAHPEVATITSSVAQARRSARGTAVKPHVFVPAFPGTNSEYDSARAFRQAGAETSTLVFRNLSAAHIEESLEAFAKQIRQSQIVMFPGGFSAGDEPDGSAKFIATVLRNTRVADAIMDLIRNRDGLVLGICNGFQALIKTGLVPYGEIREPKADAPTLTFNDIGRHISCYVNTRVSSTLSPWLANSQVGDIHTIPMSHGEGKFLADPAVIAALAKNGQIATQYCDHDGVPSMDIPFNPNGSMFAIEGISSPCGRVFGKMGHSERRGIRVGKNIPGEKFQELFKAGVNYFA